MDADLEGTAEWQIPQALCVASFKAVALGEDGQPY